MRYGSIGTWEETNRDFDVNFKRTDEDIFVNDPHLMSNNFLT